MKFHDDLVLENLSKPRLILYVTKMRLVARSFNKDLDKATKDDLKKYVSSIQQKDISVWTKQVYKVAVKRFYRWLGKEIGENEKSVGGSE